jgi:hypothetical protein
MFCPLHHCREEEAGMCVPNAHVHEQLVQNWSHCQAGYVHPSRHSLIVGKYIMHQRYNKRASKKKQVVIPV